MAIPKYIVLHHSASPQNQTAQTIDDYHKQKWNFKSSFGKYAGYQYIIVQDGTITQHRADNEAGAHCVENNMNYQSIGICVVGWYDDGHDNLPTSAQQKSLSRLLKEKMKQWGIPRSFIKFHRDYAPKSCPGNHITQEWLDSLLLGETNSSSPHMKEQLEKIQRVLHAVHDTGFVPYHLDHQSFSEIIEDKRWDDAVTRTTRLEEAEKKLADTSGDLDVQKREVENLTRQRLDLAQQLDNAQMEKEKLYTDIEGFIQELERLRLIIRDKDLQSEGMTQLRIELDREREKCKELQKSIEELTQESKQTDVAYRLATCYEKSLKQEQEIKKLNDHLIERNLQYNTRVKQLEDAQAKDYSSGQLLSMAFRKFFSGK